MTLDEKIKTLDSKIEASKAQYKLVREATKISALSSDKFSFKKFLCCFYE